MSEHNGARTHRRHHRVAGTIRFIGEEGVEITPEEWAGRLLHEDEDDLDAIDEKLPGVVAMARAIERRAE